MWAVACKHLPDEPGGKSLVRLSPQLYRTLDEADEYCKQVRYQNLPYRAYPVAVAMSALEHQLDNVKFSKEEK